MTIQAIDVEALATELSLELLPEIIEEIAQVIGMKNTMLLVKRFGGTELRVPKCLDNVTAAALVSVLGETVAMQFMNVYHGDKVYLPKCDVALRELRNLGMIQAVNGAVVGGMSKTAAIKHYAVQYGMTEHWAYKVFDEYRDCDSLQQDLIF